MEILDYEVLTRQLGKPVGKFKFAASMQFVRAKTENGYKEMNTDLGESLGETSEEASHKMHERYKEWLSAQSKN